MTKPCFREKKRGTTRIPKWITKEVITEFGLSIVPRLLTRFWEKVEKKGPNDCWEWLAAKSNGYGVFTLITGHTRLAHQISYLIHKGPIQTGLFVCHSCDNPACCNPAHLWAGTAMENTRDAAKKNRMNSAKGSRKPYAKLSEEDIPYIRYLLEEGISQMAIGKMYGVHGSIINEIQHKKAWKHVV